MENQNDSKALSHKLAPKEPHQSCRRRFSQLIAEWRSICKFNENEAAELLMQVSQNSCEGKARYLLTQDQDSQQYP